MRIIFTLIIFFCGFCSAAQGTFGNIVQHTALELFGEDGAVSSQTIVNHSLEHLNTFFETQEAAGDFMDGLTTLSSNECAPDFSETTKAQDMVLCKEDEACLECYDKAKAKMDFFRRQLGRLNCIYKNTTSFSKNAIAFGDNTSGVHAMAGLAWQKEKATINASLKKLKITYDTRYTEFIQGLKGALQEFDACEKRYGQTDWFQKNGFIYFEFMKERYKRDD